MDNHGDPDYDARRCHTDRELYSECPPPCVVPLRRRFVNGDPLPTALIGILQAKLLGGGDLKKRRKKQAKSLDKARAAKAEGLDSRKRRFADSSLSCSKTATGERRC